MAAAAEETAAGSSPLSAALPEETYNEMPLEAQEALDELGEWDITPDCRRDYARRMSHYSTYLQDNGMEGLLREDSEEQLPDKLVAHYRGSKVKFWPNRIDYKNISYKNFRACCAQARKSVKGGTPGETQLYSHTDIRKMKDSLLYHLRIVGVIPPPPFPASFVPKRPRRHASQMPLRTEVGGQRSGGSESGSGLRTQRGWCFNSLARPVETPEARPHTTHPGERNRLIFTLF